MFAICLISLFTAIGAGYFYLHVSEEVPRILALAIVAVSFFLELVLAPWPIQLLIVIVVLITTRNVSLRNQRSLP